MTRKFYQTQSPLTTPAQQANQLAHHFGYNPFTEKIGTQPKQDGKKLIFEYAKAGDKLEVIIITNQSVSHAPHKQNN